MHALFEDAGKFLAGRILSETDSAAQVELDTGRRVKVKAAHVLLRFDPAAAPDLLAQARALASGIEPDLAWEFAPQQEFGFAELAHEYFSAQATPVQQAAALLALFDAPHYFRRAGKGRFRKAPQEAVQQALAAMEKKQKLLAQIDAWSEALVNAKCPEPVRGQLYKILFRPDKNAPEYKAVVQASRAAQLPPLQLLHRAGAIASAYAFHWQRFVFEHFPQGTQFAALDVPQPPADLPLAAVQAFSIDDSETTEIDDALSVQGLGSGSVTVGIHIAAPALGLAAGSALDAVARTRASTVYMPGHKITMLPDSVVRLYTLDAGRANPAVSLYVTVDEATLETTASQTLLERVPVQANLRYDTLEHIATEAWLQNPHLHVDDTPEVLRQWRAELAFLLRWAKHRKAAREAARGKPETFARPDYSFRLLDKTTPEPTGQERVEITERRRGAALDSIVSEAAIVANSTWGGWLAELGVPGIYRSQAALGVGMKARMSTRALPHAGIGVPSYTWATSPLRRYVDLVNQWQIVACARHGSAAALAAPFKPKDVALFAIIKSFEDSYGAYKQHQTGMERLWTLKYLQQNAVTELSGRIIKDGAGSAPPLVRADKLPLVLAMLGGAQLPRGAHVRLRLGAIDEIALDVAATFVERLDGDGAAPDAAEDEAEEAPPPVALAIDVGEVETEAPDPAPAP